MADAPPGPRYRRILLVEDDYVIAMDMADMLKGFGVEVMGPAGTVAQALSLLASDPAGPDFAILDLDLHGTPSYAVADMLMTRGTPLLFITGFSADAVPARYRSCPRLEKPVGERALRAALQSLQ